MSQADEEKGRETSVAGKRGPLRIAIAGNPNSGKTSLFNGLTGTVQSVGNYPGVTVELKGGKARRGGREIRITDLPGTYSLTAYSLDELVARNHIIEERPEVVVDVVDATNLERNLYLTTQLMELDIPLVIALNMIDVAKHNGLSIDVEKLSAMLGAPVVPTVAVRGKGSGALLDACLETSGTRRGLAYQLDYGHGVEEVIRDLTRFLERLPGIPAVVPRRWLAVKLLEGDPEVEKSLREALEDFAPLQAVVERSIGRIASHFREEAYSVIPERRYGFASGVVKRCVHRTGEARQDVTDRIDAVVCHRFIGPLILVSVVYGLFLSIFKVADEWPWLLGRSPTGWVEWFFEFLTGLVEPLADSAPLLHSLLADGVIAGVGGVMSFVPLIAVLFMMVAFLEDSGYIARVAFIMDRVLRTFGLQGKSILALIVSGGLGGGGCAVPGVMATRTLREEKDRLLTILVVPFMNCGAKMPLYLMLIAAFFAWRRAEMLLLLWAISWVVTLGVAWVLRRVLIRGEQTPFVMELPAYHLPTLKGVLLHAWERTWMYIKKAGTIILVVNLILWALMFFPRLPEKKVERFETRQETAEAAMVASLEEAGERAKEGIDWTAFLDDPANRERIEAMEAAIREARGKKGVKRLSALRALQEEGGEVFPVARVLSDLERREALEEERDKLRATLEADPADMQSREALAPVDASLEQIEEHLAATDPAAVRAARAFRTFRDVSATVENEKNALQLRNSVAGVLGRGLATVSRVAGFDWRDNIALIGGFAAKEVVVGTLGTAYAMGDVDPEEPRTLSERLREDPGWTPLRAFAMMIFVMLYAPCFVTLAVMRRETNSWRWPIFSTTFNTIVAFVLAVLVYQGGLLVGLGG